MRSLQRPALWLVAIPLIILLASCRSSGNTEPSEQAPSTPNAVSDPDATSAEDEQIAADAAIIALSDLPAGWSDGGPDDDDSNDDITTSPECQFLNNEAQPGEVAKANSHEFISPDRRLLFSDSSVYESERQASDSIDVIRTGYLSTCREDLEAGMRTAFAREFSASGQTVLPEDVLVSIRNLAIPVIGDDSIGIVLKYSIRDLTAGEMDIVAVRHGRVTSGFVYLASSTDSERIASLATLTAQKAAAASSLLQE